MPGLGDTFMLPKPGVEKEHLWALVTAPDSATDEAIMVNLATQRSHSDTTTVLQPGEHPFVDRPTVAFFADARLVKVSLLDASVQQGIARAHTALSEEVLTRIQNGLLVSPFTPGKIKKAFASAQAKGLT
jgi:hypothetical protein